MLQLDDVRLDVGVVVRERLDAVGIEALLANPLEGSELILAIGRDAAGHHLFSADARVPTVAEEQGELAFIVRHLDRAKPCAMTWNPDARALLDEVERRKRTFRAIASRMGYPLLMRILQDRATELLNARIDWEIAELTVTLDRQQRGNIVRYCSFATAAALEEWITGRLELCKEELGSFLIQSFSHQLAGSRLSSD